MVNMVVRDLRGWRLLVGSMILSVCFREVCWVGLSLFDDLDVEEIRVIG